MNNSDPVSKQILEAPKHQVAGHRAESGQLGPLVDGSGRFYKPLQSGDRGSRELAFYSSFSSESKIPNHIRRYFPQFHGTQLLEASDGSGLLPHLVLEDIVCKYLHPCIIDIKLGSRTWYPQASEEYIQRGLTKDRETSSLTLGFRISGLQIYETDRSSKWKPERKFVQSLNAGGVREILKKFVSSSASPDDDVVPDCRFGSCVYGGPTGILSQLIELKSWFEDQTMYSFNSCSVLLVYDKDRVIEGERFKAEMKLIDFAHVLEGNGVIDHNSLGGLSSLIKFVSQIVEDQG